MPFIFLRWMWTEVQVETQNPGQGAALLAEASLGSVASALTTAEMLPRAFFLLLAGSWLHCPSLKSRNICATSLETQRKGTQIYLLWRPKWDTKSKFMQVSEGLRKLTSWFYVLSIYHLSSIIYLSMYLCVWTYVCMRIHIYGKHLFATGVNSVPQSICLLLIHLSTVCQKMLSTAEIVTAVLGLLVLMEKRM
jgi:hypothetical protein